MADVIRAEARIFLWSAIKRRVPEMRIGPRIFTPEMGNNDALGRRQSTLIVFQYGGRWMYDGRRWRGRDRVYVLVGFFFW